MYFTEWTRNLVSEKKTVQSLFDTILKELSEQTVYSDAAEILDYNLCASDNLDLSQIENIWDYQVVALLNTGGSEGIYVDLFLKPARSGEEKIDIGTWKTLDEGPAGYAKMGVIAGLLTYATEVWMYRNF